ncbi:jg14080, partial [Pararge aegeria aegeria]
SSIIARGACADTKCTFHRNSVKRLGCHSTAKLNSFIFWGKRFVHFRPKILRFLNHLLVLWLPFLTKWIASFSGGNGT